MAEVLKLPNKHKSRFPRLLDEGIEVDWKDQYGQILLDMDKEILKTIKFISVNKNKSQ